MHFFSVILVGKTCPRSELCPLQYVQELSCVWPNYVCQIMYRSCICRMSVFTMCYKRESSIFTPCQSFIANKYLGHYYNSIDSDYQYDCNDYCRRHYNSVNFGHCSSNIYFGHYSYSNILVITMTFYLHALT